MSYSSRSDSFGRAPPKVYQSDELKLSGGPRYRLACPPSNDLPTAYNGPMGLFPERPRAATLTLALVIIAPAPMAVVDRRDTSRAEWRDQAPNPLTPLPTALQGREQEFLAAWARAKTRLETFARQHNLNHPDLHDVRLTVVATQKELAPGPFPTPSTMVAHARWKSVHAVPPEIFAEILPSYARLREDAWSRLLAHELSHSWIRFGPRWFREGLAIIAADQGIGEAIKLTTPNPALTSLDWQNDPQAHPLSAAHVRLYMERIPLRELLAKAAAPDFQSWIRERWQSQRLASRGGEKEQD